MTRKLTLFVLGVLASLMVLPAINIRDAKTSDVWSDPTVLYVMDPVVALASELLFPFGISIDSQNVTVGRFGWLHLSDFHNQSLTKTMTAATDEDRQTANNIGKTLTAWNDLLTDRGVKLFRVMIGPNKSTIYPETLPDWAQPAAINGASLIFGPATAPFVVDSRPALLQAKARENVPVYYPMDSHWNILGARAAFVAFAEDVAKQFPDLVWPSAAMLERTKDGPEVGADLKPLLKLANFNTETDPRLAVEDWDIPTEIINASTGKLRVRGGNTRVLFSMTPEIIRSPKALNQRKVLWLRDSFGNALSPMMAATFTEVMAVHWSTGLVPGEEFLRLVDTFKPDYVFVTVVERDARKEAFASFPKIRPVYPVNTFIPLQESLPQSANDISPGAEPGELVMDGPDPFLVFSIPGGFAAEQARFIGLAVACMDGTSNVPVQLFWASDRFPNFDEAHSQRLTASAEPKVLDLGALPELQSAGRLTRLRVDLDTRDICKRFKVAYPVFGSVTLPDGGGQP